MCIFFIRNNFLKRQKYIFCVENLFEWQSYFFGENVSRTKKVYVFFGKNIHIFSLKKFLD